MGGYPISVGGSHPSQGGSPGERLTGSPGDTPPVDRGPIDYDNDGTAANTLLSGIPSGLAQAPVRNAGSTAAGKNSAGRDDPIALLRTANAEGMPRCCGRMLVYKFASSNSRRMFADGLDGGGRPDGG